MQPVKYVLGTVHLKSGRGDGRLGGGSQNF